MSDQPQDPEANPEPVEVDDPEYQIEQHILLKRRDEINRAQFEALLSQNLTQLSKIFDGSTYAFVKLTLTNKGLTNIPKTIIKYPHLRYITLNNNLLTNISSLTPLKYIVDLNLSKNLIEDVNSLANDENFPYLETLNISGNKLKRLTSVYLRKIKHLNANNNIIEDITDFDGNKTLEILELRGNKIEDISKLAHLPKLKQLYLADNKISDFSGIRQLDSLIKLHLRKNRVANIETFPQLPCLTYLNLRENTITKIDSLKGVSQTVKILNILANPLSEQLGDNAKKEIWMLYRQFDKVNKSEVTAQQKQDFDKEYKDRLAQKERQRLEKQAAEREAAEAAKNQAD